MLKPGKFKEIAKETAYSLNCLPAKHEDLHSVPQNPRKHLHAVVHACYPRADAVDTGRSLESGARQPKSINEFKTSTSPCIKNQEG